MPVRLRRISHSLNVPFVSHVKARSCPEVATDEADGVTHTYIYSQICMHTLTTDVDDLYANQGRAVAFQAQHRAAGSQVPAYRLVLETDVRARMHMNTSKTQ